MRIISSFHDFYDSVQRTGQDHSLIYKRYQSKTKIGTILDFHGRRSRSEQLDPFPLLPRTTRHLSYTKFSQHLVGFCGSIYPVLDVIATTRGSGGFDYNNRLCFNVKEVDAYVAAHCARGDVQHYNPRGRLLRRGNARRDIANWFSECERRRTDFGKWFDDQPIWITSIEDGDLIMERNGCLKDYEFYKIIDPFRAYQEIAMFLGNLAEPRKPIPPISDEVMAGAKGFDKWSFRKEPANTKA